MDLAVRTIINQEDNRDNVLMTAQANYKTLVMSLRVLFDQILTMFKLTQDVHLSSQVLVNVLNGVKFYDHQRSSFKSFFLKKFHGI